MDPHDNNDDIINDIINDGDDTIGGWIIVRRWICNSVADKNWFKGQTSPSVTYAAAAQYEQKEYQLT